MLMLMTKRKDKKKLSLDKYTGFQKFWIIFLLIVLVISLFLTVFQGIRLLLSDSSDSSAAGMKKTTKTTEVSLTNVDTIVLQETEDAGKDYVDETLFLGDSNTVRFMSFTDEDGETFTTEENTIAVAGMGVDAIDSLECMQFSTGTFTMVKSVEILQPRRVIITFGTNNLTGNDSDSVKASFIESYTKQLKKIEDAYPTVDIIVNSIPPISQSTVYTKLNAKQILHWNEAIEEMCEENDWHYLNSYEVLADEDTGYALDGMMDTDGLHLSKKGIQTLFDYIRTHAYITDDDRPDLEDIPTIIGPLTSLYTVDPLSGDEFDESVLHPTDETASPEATSTTEATADTSLGPGGQTSPSETETPSPANPITTPESSAVPSVSPTPEDTTQTTTPSSDPSPASTQTTEPSAPQP